MRYLKQFLLQRVSLISHLWCDLKMKEQRFKETGLKTPQQMIALRKVRVNLKNKLCVHASIRFYVDRLKWTMNMSDLMNKWLVWTSFFKWKRLTKQPQTCSLNANHLVSESFSLLAYESFYQENQMQIKLGIILGFWRLASICLLTGCSYDKV